MTLLRQITITNNKLLQVSKTYDGKIRVNLNVDSNETKLHVLEAIQVSEVISILKNILIDQIISYNEAIITDVCYPSCPLELTENPLKLSPQLQDKQDKSNDSILDLVIDQ